MHRRLTHHAAWRGFALLGFLCFLSLGCGSFVQKGQAGSDLTSDSTDGGDSDAGLPGGDGGAVTDAGQAVVLLNVVDYNNGCDVTENGEDAGVYSSMSAYGMGSVVALGATALPGYVWGYWTGTDVDGGSVDIDATTTVTMDENKLVVACCPAAPPAAQVCPTPMP